MTIYSYLQGGLGNQMFQYAIARSLSIHYGVDFRLDCSWFKNQHLGVTPRTLDLQFLRINQNLIHDQLPSLPKRKLLLSLQTYLPIGPIIKKQANAFSFDAELFNLKKMGSKDLYLFGYWQSYKYFDEIRSELQNEFQASTDYPAPYAAYLKLIQTSESVMIHIRRGDYVNSPSAAQFHGALSLDYYLSAIKEFSARNKDIHFFVFSDDLLWAKSALPKDLQITFIETSLTETSSVHELQLMTECKHHIIANSSFSWWGAWLKKDPAGSVFTPNRWVANENLDLHNLLPKNWIKLAA